MNLGYDLGRKFPCLHFEIYEDYFADLTGRLIYPLSERIQPLLIDKKAKWNYMEKKQFNHLQAEHIPFDKLIEAFNNALRQQ